MDAVFSNFDLVLRAFGSRWSSSSSRGSGSLVLGTLLAAMRVGPVRCWRRSASTYVAVVRNTPLLVVFVFVFIALPTLDLRSVRHRPFLLQGRASR